MIAAPLAILIVFYSRPVSRLGPDIVPFAVVAGTQRAGGTVKLIQRRETHGAELHVTSYHT